MFKKIALAAALTASASFATWDYFPILDGGKTRPNLTLPTLKSKSFLNYRLQQQPATPSLRTLNSVSAFRSSSTPLTMANLMTTLLVLAKFSS